MTLRMSLLIAGVLVAQMSAVAQDRAAEKHVTVYFEKGRFGGWPANYGIWIWGNEILVGFNLGYHKDLGPTRHNIDPDKPTEPVFARSLDGGESWTVEHPNENGFFLAEKGGAGSEGAREAELKKAVPCPGGIDFTHPDFAMTMRMTSKDSGEGLVYYSYDRGHTWQGPYLLPHFGSPGLAPRTDYIVDGKNACTALITAAKSDAKEGRPLCIRTRDGGANWEFVSWIGPEPKGYAIMTSTVRVSANELFTAVRCREGEPSWISGYRSRDDGTTWESTGEPIAQTGEGNPPSLLKLRDGRLCLIYGYRAEPFGMCAKLSSDAGETWGPETVIRGDVAGRDMGYPRSVERPDGKVVTVYYLHDEKMGPERFIEATIWDPTRVK